MKNHTEIVESTPGLLSAAQAVMAWADTANVANNSQRCETIHNLRKAIKTARITMTKIKFNTGDMVKFDLKDKGAFHVDSSWVSTAGHVYLAISAIQDNYSLIPAGWVRQEKMTKVK